IGFICSNDSAVFFLNAEVGRLRSLQDRVAVFAVEVEQRKFAFRRDRGEKWLSHQRAVGEPSAEFISLIATAARTDPKRSARIRADDRFEHDFFGADPLD